MEATSRNHTHKAGVTSHAKKEGHASFALGAVLGSRVGRLMLAVAVLI
jgi:hypothetical protein